MITFENTDVVGWEHAIRGMRNPLNSWKKTDSESVSVINSGEDEAVDRMGFWYRIGPNDLALMKKLRAAGTDHGKFMRMITVYVDITAPMYWWSEFDTYKVGTVANSCSKMHTIHKKEFTEDDFSFDKILSFDEYREIYPGFQDTMKVKERLIHLTISMLNSLRSAYLVTKDKKLWYAMIQLLPASYNQKRTIMLNYEVLRNMYKSRKNHKLNEWHDFCHWIEGLPYSELITGEE